MPSTIRAGIATAPTPTVSRVETTAATAKPASSIARQPSPFTRTRGATAAVLPTLNRRTTRGGSPWPAAPAPGRCGGGGPLGIGHEDELPLLDGGDVGERRAAGHVGDAVLMGDPRVGDDDPLRIAVDHRVPADIDVAVLDVVEDVLAARQVEQQPRHALRADGARRAVVVAAAAIHDARPLCDVRCLVRHGGDPAAIVGDHRVRLRLDAEDAAECRDVRIHRVHGDRRGAARCGCSFRKARSSSPRGRRAWRASRPPR